MKTAVQLLRQAGKDRPKSELVCGTPSSIVTGRHGPVALFDPGQLVGYRIGCRRQARLFVFRTLEVDDRLAAAIPGVRPRVQLLFEVQTPGRARLVRGMFMYLAKKRSDPARLPDGFYVRIGLALAGRLQAHKILPSLLTSAAGGTLIIRRGSVANRVTHGEIQERRSSDRARAHRGGRGI